MRFFLRVSPRLQIRFGAEYTIVASAGNFGRLRCPRTCSQCQTVPTRRIETKMLSWNMLEKSTVQEEMDITEFGEHQEEEASLPRAGPSSHSNPTGRGKRQHQPHHGIGAMEQALVTARAKNASHLHLWHHYRHRFPNSAAGGDETIFVLTRVKRVCGLWCCITSQICPPLMLVLTQSVSEGCRVRLERPWRERTLSGGTRLITAVHYFTIIVPDSTHMNE